VLLLPAAAVRDGQAEQHLHLQGWLLLLLQHLQGLLLLLAQQQQVMQQEQQTQLAMGARHLALHEQQQQQVLQVRATTCLL
jgi:hypothetical protein